MIKFQDFKQLVEIYGVLHGVFHPDRYKKPTKKEIYDMIKEDFQDCEFESETAMDYFIQCYMNELSNLYNAMKGNWDIDAMVNKPEGQLLEELISDFEI